MGSIKQIALDLNVSSSTVSRAFDPNSKISKKTRERILEYAKKINYTPNIFAQALKTNQSKTVGVIVPHIANLLYTELLKYMEMALKNYGYRMLVTFAQYGVVTERECLSFMASYQFDALIYLEPLYGIKNSELLESIAQNVRVLHLFPQKSNVIDSIDSIAINDIKGIERGMEYLIRRGHKKILYLGVDERREGIFNIAKRLGVSLDEDITIMEGLYVDPEQIAYYIEAHRPTAIFTVARNIESAYEAIKNLNLSVPNDISLISYDDTRLTQILNITAISHNFELISNNAVEMIVSHLRDKPEEHIPKHKVIDTFIRERKSVRALSDSE